MIDHISISAYTWKTPGHKRLKHAMCTVHLTTLIKGAKVLPDDIRQALMVVVECCMKRDYLAAMDHYIKLAIGNAPWPIGVTMFGIHERSAREKRFTLTVWHT